MTQYNPIELLKNLQDAAFVLKTQQQIAKDFGKVQLHFSGYFVEVALEREHQIVFKGSPINILTTLFYLDFGSFENVRFTLK